MKTVRAITIILSFLIAVSGVGCVVLSEWIAPTELDRASVQYTVERGVAEPNEFSGYQNLAKAKKLQQYVDNAYALRMKEIEQEADSEQLEHSIYARVTHVNVQSGMERAEILFGEKGLFSLGLSIAGFGAFTGLLGLMRKRPGDVTAAEMEQAVTTVTGQTTEDLNNKDRQFVQLVKGVQEFMKTYGNDDAIGKLEDAMDKHQDTETKIAVATAKKRENV